MKVAVRNLSGETVSEIDVSDLVFGAPINEPVMHQAIVRQQANARTGTHDTKTRGEVRGGGRKPYRQKGTGRARQGSTRAPHYRTGGVAFGPHPRDYRQDMPRKMRILALRSALSARAASDGLIVVENLDDFTGPSTRQMRDLLAALGVGRSTLVVVPEAAPNVFLSARNLDRVTPVRANHINILAVLGHQSMVVTVDAIRAIEGWLGKPIRKADRAEEAPSAEPAA